MLFIGSVFIDCTVLVDSSPVLEKYYSLGSFGHNCTSNCIIKKNLLLIILLLQISEAQITVHPFTHPSPLGSAEQNYL